MRAARVHAWGSAAVLEDMGEAVESLAKGAAVGRVVLVPAVGQQSVGVDPGGGHEQTAA